MASKLKTYRRFGDYSTLQLAELPKKEPEKKRGGWATAQPRVRPTFIALRSSPRGAEAGAGAQGAGAAEEEGEGVAEVAEPVGEGGAVGEGVADVREHRKSSSTGVALASQTTPASGAARRASSRVHGEAGSKRASVSAGTGKERKESHARIEDGAGGDSASASASSSFNQRSGSAPALPVRESIHEAPANLENHFPDSSGGDAGGGGAAGKRLSTQSSTSAAPLGAGAAAPPLSGSAQYFPWDPTNKRTSRTAVPATGTILTPSLLMASCFTENPLDVYSARFVDRGLAGVGGDFSHFTNLSHLNCSDNPGLGLELFGSFPHLVALQLAMNDLTSFSFSPDTFSTLTILDLSYNQLSAEAILSLALLPNLVALDLSGNCLRSLPFEMSGSSLVVHESSRRRSTRDGRGDGSVSEAYEVDESVSEAGGVVGSGGVGGQENSVRASAESVLFSLPPPTSSVPTGVDTHTPAAAAAVSSAATPRATATSNSNSSSATATPSRPGPPTLPTNTPRTVVHFSALENLVLDHNEMADASVFASLAGLPRLRYVSLAHNRIPYIPYLVAAATRDEGDDGTSEAGGASSARESVAWTTKRSEDAAFGGLDRGSVATAASSAPLYSSASSSSSSYTTATTASTSTASTTTASATTSATTTASSATTTSASSHAFPCLEVLNMNHNRLRTSQDVVEVSQWPLLRALHVIGNPVTLCRRGLPAELSYVLHDQRGIQVVTKLIKPRRPPVRMDLERMVTVGPALPRMLKPADKITLLPPIAPLPAIEAPADVQLEDAEDGEEEEVLEAEPADAGGGFFLTQTDDVNEVEEESDLHGGDDEDAGVSAAHAVPGSSGLKMGVGAPLPPISSSSSSRPGNQPSHQRQQQQQLFQSSKERQQLTLLAPPSSRPVHNSSNSTELYSRYAENPDHGFDELWQTGDADENRWTASLRALPADVMSLSHALKLALQHPDQSPSRRAPPPQKRANGKLPSLSAKAHARRRIDRLQDSLEAMRLRPAAVEQRTDIALVAKDNATRRVAELQQAFTRSLRQVSLDLAKTS